jgi:hypothetical protein
MTAAAPAFLLAGGLLAVVPVVLHLLSRRPPARAPLPTARFLAEDPRTLLRIRRTPGDLPLLAARVLFALALGAAFAGLRWLPGREGTERVVLVDAGADSLVAWGSVVAAVNEVAGSSTREAASSAGEGDLPLILAYGLDDGPKVVQAGELPGLQRGSSSATLEDGLRALRREAARAGFAHAEVTWVGRPSWRVWSPALGLVRPALWPGRLRLHTVADEGDRDSGTASPSRADSVSAGAGPPRVRIAVESSDEALRRAVTALGGWIPDSAATAQDSVPDWIVAETADREGPAGWLPRVRAGAALVVFGALPPDASELPWREGPSDVPHPGPAVLLLPGGRAVGPPLPRAPGNPAPGARTVLTFDDGGAAAAARTLGEGCIVYLAVELTDAALTAAPDYPELLRTLLLGCPESGFGDAPLDPGAVQALERPDLPAAVEVATVVGSEGHGLTRWLLLAALALLGLEVALTRDAPGTSAAGRSVGVGSDP